MKRLAVVVGVGLALVAGWAQAQEPNIFLHRLMPEVTSSDDDFSSSRRGTVTYGPLANDEYRNVTIKISVRAAGEQTSFDLMVVLDRIDVQGGIVAIAARGGTEFPALTPGSSGRVNCGRSRYSRCSVSFAQTFGVPETVIGQLRAGEPVDVRIRTTQGVEHDLVFRLPVKAVTALDRWLEP